MTQKILLVEGPNDTLFFQAWCREVRLKGITVAPPAHLGAQGMGKGNAFKLLPTLLQQLKDGTVDRLGIVLDADHPLNHHQGFDNSYRKIAGYLESALKFNVPKRLPPQRAGFLFDHPDGLPPVGLWIMPDNRQDGMLEDFIKQAITTEPQKEVLEEACSAVSRLNPPLFNRDFHLSKAEIATWLAWQAEPGKPMASAVGDQLIDLKSPLPDQFTQWLRQVFQ